MVKKTGNGHLVRIIGHNRLQNDLLAYFLEKETGIKCVSSPDFSNIRFDRGRGKGLCLILRNCQGIDPGNPWSGIGIGAKSRHPEYTLALFNVPRGKKIEKKIAERGIRGIFYEDAPLERFQKGIPAILDGELWFPRSVMVKPFLNLSETRPVEKQATLTPSEKGVLILIASGATTAEIADELHISSHTVKNHISSIYKKINVHNRLQAALWAALYI